MGDVSLRVTPLTTGLFAGWSALFEACASGCFCRYWHFAGTKNAWLERLALDPGANAEEQRAGLSLGDASARGLVALASVESGTAEVVVGWLKLVPRAAAPKLRRLPVYRALDLGPDDGVLSIACFLVHPAHRRRGVARALLEGAVGAAERAGARVLEAYPHLRSEALRDEELWMGPASLFDAYGFESVGGNGAYPVLRRAVVTGA